MTQMILEPTMPGALGSSLALVRTMLIISASLPVKILPCLPLLVGEGLPNSCSNPAKPSVVCPVPVRILQRNRPTGNTNTSHIHIY